MNIALFGYGKMGKAVELAAIERGQAVVARFDVGDALDQDSLSQSKPDVIIDFTESRAVLEHVKVAATAKVPMVIGTTGWEDSFADVKSTIESAGIGCIYASNFSIGVNIFLEIVRKASGMLSAAGYDAYVLEAHHNAKKDFPSGTALRIAEAMLETMPTKSKIISSLFQGQPIDSDSLLVSSIRAGSITGTHTVGFESEEDSIELTHRAKSRKGFALGAVRAAEWIVHNRGLFQFEASIQDVLGLQKS